MCVCQIMYKGWCLSQRVHAQITGHLFFKPEFTGIPLSFLRGRLLRHCSDTADSQTPTIGDLQVPQAP